MVNYGKAIKLIRVERELTQDELAKKTEIATISLCLIKTGKRTPSLNMLEKIANGLETNIEYLTLLSIFINNKEFMKFKKRMLIILEEECL